MEVKHIDLIYDYLDEAAMIVYDELHLDYIQALIRVLDDVIKGTNVSGLNNEAINALNHIYQNFTNHSFLNEEIRIALQLLIIKGFKHKGQYSLDLMTPDGVSYIFAYIINLLGENNITIMDVAVGTGNLINAISNFVNFDINLIGVDIDSTLCELTRAVSDMQNNNITVYCNDNLFPILDTADIIIGDLDPSYKDDKYTLYELVTKFCHNLNEDGYFIYLIPNDFFNQTEINAFKQAFPGTLAGLIVLPETMFHSNHIGKSLLVGTKKQMKDFELLLVNFPSLQDQEKVKETIVMIDEWIKNLKGMIV